MPFLAAPPVKRHFMALLTVAACLWAHPLWAGGSYVGVANCAGSTCHGAIQRLGDHGIRQDEYFIWQQQDPHTRATQRLQEPLARAMGEKLGIDPVRDPTCRGCHTAGFGQAQYGPRFQPSDGIDCETCHGSAGTWLSQHTQPGLTAAQRLRMGMVPTWEADSRAALCQGCHQGGPGVQRITHAMMAAGHPRLVFELETFAALAVPHYDRDADYARRKGSTDPARDWGTGQVMAAIRQLDQVSRGGLGSGVMPELMHFDCAACHHDMTAQRARPNRVAGAAIGTVPLADSAIHNAGLWLKAIAPAQAEAFGTQWQAVQTALVQSPADLGTQAAALAETLRAALPHITRQSPKPDALRALLQDLASLADGPRAGDFASTEQAAMAFVAISESLRRAGQPLPPTLRQHIETLYSVVRTPEGFKRQEAENALRALARAMGPHSAIPVRIPSSTTSP